MILCFNFQAWSLWVPASRSTQHTYIRKTT